MRAMRVAAKRAERLAREEQERRYALEQERLRRLDEEQAYNPYEVKVRCYLRPAKLQDMEGVTALYDREVTQSYTMVDTQPLGVSRFRQFFQGIKAQSMPFIVVKKGRHSEDNENPVIGFAVVEALARGLMGSYETSTKPCGRVIMIVQPDWRHQHIGAALLDAILNCCSERYMGKGKGGYRFVNPDEDRACLFPPHNARQWRILQLEVLLKSDSTKDVIERSDEYTKVVEYMKDFLFALVGHDHKLYYHPSPDLGIGWLDRLIFHHKCDSSRF
jgi:L-amino acid N-acyltransferase YncA